ncbi:hypothetical protein I600_3845 [Maribacter dokdonensis DSW-8]|nr:hypothetical protein I600_3845 [Maribacter dokdonensis DSW-8]
MYINGVLKSCDVLDSGLIVAPDDNSIVGVNAVNVVPLTT